MWILSPVGFFSAVQKPGDTHLTIRVRVKADLDALRERYFPELGETQIGGGTDYPYRATAEKEPFAAALGRIAMDIDYDNFKNEVKKQQGPSRARAYGEVWSALYDLEAKENRS